MIKGVDHFGHMNVIFQCTRLTTLRFLAFRAKSKLLLQKYKSNTNAQGRRCVKVNALENDVQSVIVD